VTPEQRSDKLAAAHLLLDALVAVSNPDNAPEDNGPALYVAMEAIVHSRQVIKFHRDHNIPAGFGVDITPLVYGCLELSQWLLTRLDETTDLDPLDVIAAFRTQLHAWEARPSAPENPAPRN
jgi:hypothetical protein